MCEVLPENDEYKRADSRTDMNRCACATAEIRPHGVKIHSR